MIGAQGLRRFRTRENVGGSLTAARSFTSGQRQSHRGFTVVAVEVRNLARRSLITKSGDREARLGGAPSDRKPL